MLVTRTVDRISAPTTDDLDAVLTARVAVATFERAFVEWQCLHELEVSSPRTPAPTMDAARVIFWNAERLKYPGSSASLLERAGADILLLCEVDVGMARSGNRHTVGELSSRLGTGYAFGVEFVELGLGDARERAWHASEQNHAGLHGAAILSRHQLVRPALARLERSGRWFDGQFDERRVGGRIALMAEVAVAGTPVLFVLAHYESHSDPADRLEQTDTLLDAIDAHGPGTPVLLAGDFNTSTFALAEKDQPASIHAALAADPLRLVAPMNHEPMFATLRGRGYGWRGCNVELAPTQRTRPDGTPAPPFGKIDWLFARGLHCSDPRIIPAVDADGMAISDHDALAVTIVPA